MSAVQVDRVLLCPWVSIVKYDAPPDDGLRISRIQNESLLQIAEAHPQKVTVLGTLPMQDPALAARELQSLMRDTAMRGVEIAASVNGAYLGDDQFRDFWAAAEESDALVFIHPTTRGLNIPLMQEYYLWNALGNPLETTMTAAHMIMAGVMEAHPNLKVLLSHGGGAILSLRGRLRHAHSFQPMAKARLQHSPEDSLKKFYFDTITHDSDLLRTLIDYVGADHVLLGSDYPFDMGDARPVESVRVLGLSSADEASILGGNAARLLGLSAT
jgi:aminocarboxymuconate-semialdehyde decarboxylase